MRAHRALAGRVGVGYWGLLLAAADWLLLLWAESIPGLLVRACWIAATCCTTVLIRSVLPLVNGLGRLRCMLWACYNLAATRNWWRYRICSNIFLWVSRGRFARLRLRIEVLRVDWSSAFEAIAKSTCGERRALSTNRTCCISYNPLLGLLISHSIFSNILVSSLYQKTMISICLAFIQYRPVATAVSSPCVGGESASFLNSKLLTDV